MKWQKLEKVANVYETALGVAIAVAVLAAIVVSAYHVYLDFSTIVFGDTGVRIACVALVCAAFAGMAHACNYVRRKAQEERWKEPVR